MENKKQGYKVRKYQGPVKRYCQMLNLKNDAALIAEYRKRHSEGKVWPETLAAIREVGILEMEIYILGTNLFMIVETPLDFDWDTAMARMATLPRQAEWEEYMSVFQQAEPGVFVRYRQSRPPSALLPSALIKVSVAATPLPRGCRHTALGRVACLRIPPLPHPNMGAVGSTP